VGSDGDGVDPVAVPALHGHDDVASTAKLLLLLELQLLIQ
jgi:hypothetical protein